MNEPRREEIKALFLAALDRDTNERGAYLDAACADDAKLRAEVDALLSVHVADATESFLRPIPFTRDVVDAPPEEDDSRIGQRIGMYEIQERLGSGGMGVVYRARRVADYEQTVAVKLVKRGMDTEEILRRFKNEMQFLAALGKHPNIAGLMDAGTTDDGMPYFVMEFVEGQWINRYCDDRQKTVVERVELFCTVCAGVDFAHQRALIHRDLKPSNVLITAEGVPKLIDFGIAKLVSPGSDDQTTSQTQTVYRILTPYYASPEQVRGDAISVASDVYSLGVVLYELLTGRRPYRSTARSPLEFERMISEQEPRRPSTVVRRTARRTGAEGETIERSPDEVSRARGESPQQLARRLSGDLDNIILKALHKDPERRYASVRHFSEDLGRHLAGLPVLARPVGPLERWWRWSKRNWRLASLSAAVLLLLIAVAVGSTVSAVRIAAARDEAHRNADAARRIAGQERRARSRADQALAAEQEQHELAEASLIRAQEAEREAQQAEAEAQQVAQFMAGLFRGSDPIAFGGYEFGAPSQGGDVLTAREMLDRGAKKITEELSNQPLVQATLIDTIGDVYATLGDLKTGIPLLERALEMRRAASGGPHPDLADSLHNVGVMRFVQGRYEESEKLLREAIAMRTDLLGADAPKTLLSKFMIAMVLLQTDVTSEVEQLLRDVVAVRSEQLEENDRDVAFAYTGLALVFAHKGETEKAFEAVQQAIAVLDSPDGQDPVAEVFMLGVQGMLQAQSGDTDGAATLFRQALDKAYEIVGEGHPAVTFLQIELGNFLVDSGDSAAAETIFRDAVTRGLKIYGRQPRTAEAMVELANLARDDGRLDEAQDLYHEALEIQRTILGSDDPYVAYSLARLATLRFDQGDLQEAQSLFEQSLKILSKRMGEDSYQLILLLCGLGAVDRAMGSHEEGAQRFERARRLARNHLAAGTIVRRLQSDAKELASLGSMLVEKGGFTAADEVLRQALAIWDVSLAADDWRVANAKSGLGAALAGLDRYDAAETLLLGAHEILSARFGNKDARTQATVSRLVNLYDDWKRPAKAEEFRKRLSNPAATSDTDATR